MFKYWIRRNNSWIEGPPLNVGRYHHTCARIKLGDEYTVITVGGNFEEALNSTEIYDAVSSRLQINIHIFL
jgi:hypothetical protein